MPRTVPYDTIDTQVVDNWKRLMDETARKRGDDLSTVQPFPPYQQTYPDVLEAVGEETPEGLEHYRRMVRQMYAFYDFGDDSESDS